MLKTGTTQIQRWEPKRNSRYREQCKSKARREVHSVWRTVRQDGGDAGKGIGLRTCSHEGWETGGFFMESL